jgi:transposase-like protein
MADAGAAFVPPFCPNPGCRFHRHASHLWRWRKDGYFASQASPGPIQRFQCCLCRRHFSTQTFSTCYWLKRPALLEPLFLRSLACSALRQIAREFRVSPTTVMHQLARLGRHCLLFNHLHHPPGPVLEPLALDGFQSFEYSQDHPFYLNLVAGRRSHFFYAFTDAELRRSGRMTPAQRRRRARWEAGLGRPDPRAIETGTAAALRLAVPAPQAIVLHTDEHQDYPRAIRRVGHLQVEHHTISSRAARRPQNPLFAVNLLDLLLRHSGAHHKRETIAFAKRRQGALERAAIFQTWRNWIKWVSERKQRDTPAMRLGLAARPLTLREVLSARLFVSRIALPEPWRAYYFREVRTRRIPNGALHRLRYAV